jgi:hypothetical protein
VDNLLGKLKNVAVAQSERAASIHPVPWKELVPGEVMVKHPPAGNAATHDWEIELDVSRRVRPFANAVLPCGQPLLRQLLRLPPRPARLIRSAKLARCDAIPITAP